MSPRMIGQTFPGQKGIKVWVQCFPWWFLHRSEIWPLGWLRWLSLTILNAVSEVLLVCPCIVSRGGRTSADLCLAATQWLARRHSEQCLFVACRSLAATCVCLFKYIVSIHLRFSWMSTLLVTLEFIGISLWNLNHIRSFQIPCHTNIFSCTMEPQWWLWVFLGASESRKSVHDSKKLFRVEAQESCLTCCSIAPAELALPKTSSSLIRRHSLRLQFSSNSTYRGGVPWNLKNLSQLGRTRIYNDHPDMTSNACCMIKWYQMNRWNTRNKHLWIANQVFWQFWGLFGTFSSYFVYYFSLSELCIGQGRHRCISN